MISNSVETKSSELVSILVPVYNRQKYIRETLLSALSQTYENIEVVVVDNCSCDDTWKICCEVASNDSRVKVFRNEVNVGPVKNWKKCVDCATGKYAKFLWSDDLIDSEFINETIKYIKENKDVGFVFSCVEIFDDSSLVKHRRYCIGGTGIYSTSRYILGALFGNNYPFSPGCALFRLSDLKKNLVVDIPNNVGSDFSMHAVGNDLLIFLLTANDYTKFAYVNKPLSLFRKHSDSISLKTKIGDLVLCYDFVKAHFVENFRQDLMVEMNSRIMVDLFKFKAKNSIKFQKISEFYMKNNDYKYSKSYVLLRVPYILKHILKNNITL